jgi:hypothetical protein
LENSRAVLDGQGKAGHLVVVVPSANALYTPYSFAALCSHHWLPQEAALAFAGARELRTAATSFGLGPANPADQINYYQARK